MICTACVVWRWPILAYRSVADEAGRRRRRRDFSPAASHWSDVESLTISHHHCLMPLTCEEDAPEHAWEPS